jgi:hypothetical protein
MNTPHALKRMIVGTLLSGGVAVAGLGLATGTAHADGHACTNSGVCNNLWCPGQRLPFSVRKPGGVLSPSEVQWDMSVCHWYFFDFGNHYGGVPVGAYGLKQGQPIAQWGY